MEKESITSSIIDYIHQKDFNYAIMLTAKWGYGKSYYIKNELIPLLKQNGVKTILISLFGLHSIVDLKSQIHNCFNNSKELNGNNDTPINILSGPQIEDNGWKTYNTDYSNSLIILEDFERANCDLSILLGYINSLVEYKNAKILIVANELEIVGEKAKNYENAKEKVVYETFHFPGANPSVLKEMLSSSIDKTIYDKYFCFNDLISDLIHFVLLNEKIYSENLRAIKFAFIKCNDLLKLVNSNLDNQFVKRILFSIVAFYLKRANNPNIYWNEDGEVLSSLGTNEFPLYRFVYDYVKYQELNIEKVLDANTNFIKQTKAKIEGIVNNIKLNVIYSYTTKTEKEVAEAIDYVYDNLKQCNRTIPCGEFMKLANYMISISYTIKLQVDKVEECLKLMTEQFDYDSKRAKETINYFGGIAIDNPDGIKRFNDFKTELKNRLSKKDNPLFVFNYKHENIQTMINETIEKKDAFIEKRGFAKYIDVQSFLKLLEECNSEEIQGIRQMFLSVYSFNNISSFYSDDKTKIQELLNGVNGLLLNTKIKHFDKIQKLQLDFFVYNLETIIERL